MTPDEQAIRERCNAATPGPWTNENSSYIFARIPGGRPNGEGIANFHDYARRTLTHEQNTANAAFAAHAREDVPALLDLVDELRGKIEKQRKCIKQFGSNRAAQCWRCGGWALCLSEGAVECDCESTDTEAVEEAKG